MLKVNYKSTALFSLKKYKDSNLNCQSYEYPTVYAIRSAILGAIIQIEGMDKAKELFYKVKNSNIYVQYPQKYKTNVIKQKRYGRSYYQSFDVMDRSKLLNANWNTVIGARQYVDLEDIVFYIDNMIPNIEIYLKNIDWLGTAESMVYLHSIEDANKIENILMKWNGEDKVNTYEQHDWNSKTSFENIYMYSDKYKRMNDSYMCSIGNIILPT